MKGSPLKLGIAGVAAYVAAVTWVFLHFRIVSRNDPPGWIVDRATPDGPKLLGLLGGACVLASILWAGVRLVRRRMSHTR